MENWRKGRFISMNADSTVISVTRVSEQIMKDGGLKILSYCPRENLILFSSVDFTPAAILIACSTGDNHSLLKGHSVEVTTTAASLVGHG